MAIDDPRYQLTEIQCPNNCGELLEYYPSQSGPCHSGLFTDSMQETYWCTKCEQNFEPNIISALEAVSNEL